MLEREKTSLRALLDMYQSMDEKASAAAAARAARMSGADGNAGVADASGCAGAGSASGSASDGREQKVAAVMKRVKQLEALLDDSQSEAKHLARHLEAAEARAAKLQAEIGKGGFDPSTTKVLHMRANPAREAGEARTQRLEAEIARLEAALRDALAAGPPADAAAGASGAAAAATPAPGAARWAGGGLGGSGGKSAAAALAAATPAPGGLAAATPAPGDGSDWEKRYRRLKEVFRKEMGKFREAVYLLTGFKVDMENCDNPRLRLRSMYAARKDDRLDFQWKTKGEDRGLQLLHSPTAAALSDEVEVYLKKFHSIPGFLSAATLKLLEATTLVPMSAGEVPEDEA
jgi:mitotic spindle assembly checkpoint protein MAD1